MKLSVSEARSQLGRLCAQAQNPCHQIILTRHGEPLAAIVSMEEVRRIWALQDEQWSGRKCVVSGMRIGKALILPRGLVHGPGGRLMTHREAAQHVREIQLTRAEERKVLADGGLEPVPEGELRETRTAPARKAPRWQFWKRRRRG